MNIHEYQGKEILKRYGVVIQEGILAHTAEEAVHAAQKIMADTGSKFVVIKAQVHAGGRGKGGGVKLAKNLDEVREKAGAILGMQLITPQTSAEGKLVSKVLVAQDVYVDGPSKHEEFYMSVLLDRAIGKNVIIYSTEGGMDIEEVAHNHPEKLHKEVIEPGLGIQPFQARKIATKLGLEGQAFKEMVVFIQALYRAYDDIDASLFEINPLFKTADNRILAVDAKVELDDNAMYRHKDSIELRDTAEEDPTEVEAGKFDLNYVKLDGNVGCMVNGAGLAMATMDIIKIAGGEPANFLDVGGTANAERVANAFRIILKDPNVKAILVNIFGGIVRCDRVANGIVDAYHQIGNIPVPIIVRLQGTNAEEAKVIIDNSGLKVFSAITLDEASALVAKVMKGETA